MSELGRRAVHASGALVPGAYLLGVLTWAQIRWLLLLGSIAAVVLEFFRLRGRVDWWIFDALTREYEQDNPAGYALYAIGMALTAWVFAPGAAFPADSPFAPRVAVASLFMLTIADPISGLLSRGDLGTKRVWVLLTTFAVCLAIASLLGIPFWAAAAGALAATYADGAKPVVAGYVIDDNLTIPLLSATATWLVLQFV